MALSLSLWTLNSHSLYKVVVFLGIYTKLWSLAFCILYLFNWNTPSVPVFLSITSLPFDSSRSLNIKRRRKDEKRKRPSLQKGGIDFYSHISRLCWFALLAVGEKRREDSWLKEEEEEEEEENAYKNPRIVTRYLDRKRKIEKVPETKVLRKQKTFPLF